MISEIDTSSVVDETESAKVTTESQMAECSTELMRRPETTDGRWIPAGMQECHACGFLPEWRKLRSGSAMTSN